MRKKLFSALAIMFFMAGLVVAADVTVQKYDAEKKEVTVKEGDKEVTYKISDKVKITTVTKDKDGNEKTTEGKFEDLEKRLKNLKPDSKFQPKWSIKTDKDTITEIKTTGRGGKKTKE